MKIDSDKKKLVVEVATSRARRLAEQVRRENIDSALLDVARNEAQNISIYLHEKAVIPLVGVHTRIDHTPSGKSYVTLVIRDELWEDPSVKPTLKRIFSGYMNPLDAIVERLDEESVVFLSGMRVEFKQ